MAEQVITGIAQSSEPEHIESTVCAQEPVDCERVAVITKDTATQAHADSIVRFIHAGDFAQTTDTSHDVIRGNTGIMTDMGGVNIPGISSDMRYFGFFAHPEIIDHFADVPIPQDQVQNYNDAIEAGRGVVTYKASPEEAPGVEQAFRDAGLKNVKTFGEATQTTP